MNIDWNHSTREQEHPVTGDVNFPQRAFMFDRLHVATLLDGLVCVCEPADLEIANVWYVPSRFLYAIYRIKNRQGERLVTIHYLPPGHSATAWDEARSRAADPKAVHHLPQDSAVVLDFPEDPQQPAIRRMTDEAYVARMIDGATGGSCDTGAFRWSMLSYLPGDRCALLQQFGHGTDRYVAKLQKDQAGRTHARMRALWQAPGRRFGMPEPVACDGVAAIRWERFVVGQRFEAKSGQELEPMLRAVCRGLVQLHCSKLDDLRFQRLADVLARVQGKVLKRIADALPHLGPRSAAFAVSLHHAAARMPQRPLLPIHGDFHSANILSRGESVHFIDLDSLSLGDPALDLALLGTRMVLEALVADRDVVPVAAAVSKLPALYAEAGGEPVPESVFAWYVAAMLVARQLRTCIRHLAPGLPRIAPVLLDAAVATLARGRLDTADFAG